MPNVAGRAFRARLAVSATVPYMDRAEYQTHRSVWMDLHVFERLVLPVHRGLSPDLDASDWHAGGRSQTTFLSQPVRISVFLASKMRLDAIASCLYSMFTLAQVVDVRRARPPVTLRASPRKTAGPASENAGEKV